LTQRARALSAVIPAAANASVVRTHSFEHKTDPHGKGERAVVAAETANDAVKWMRVIRNPFAGESAQVGSSRLKSAQRSRKHLALDLRRAMRASV